MFRHLRTKLTVLYAGLFAAILLLISLIGYSAISENALNQGDRELATSGSVFDRVWELRAGQLENGAFLLSRDFGFRTAVASTDAPTIRTALDNLKQRLGIDLALLIGVDGRVVYADDESVAVDGAALATLQANDGDSGVIVLGGMPYEAVSVPVMAPLEIGSVVFANKLDAQQMRALESMAAVPLDASVRYRLRPGVWSRANGADSDGGAAIDRAFVAGAQAPLTLPSARGPALTLVKPLKMMDARHPAVLTLQYPISRALAPYRSLFAILMCAGGLGLVAIMLGTWVLARNVTRPISALEDAARRLKRGEQAAVEVGTRDEIGRLAQSFNSMAAEIIQRERESREAAAALEVARDRAEAANRAKSSFLTNMSHELRTPLNGLVGVAGLLAQTALDAKQAGMVAIIENSASALRRVLSDVLDMARVEAGRMDIVREPFDLEAAVAALAASTDAQCQAKGLAFLLSMDEEARRFVVGDRVRLEQVLANLLNNAVKFTEAGEVFLTVAVCDREASIFRFEVRDTGVGFDAAAAAALFRPFQQADGSMTRRHGGAGLGLSISRELARAMGGDITVVAAPGQGASFTLLAPLPGCERPSQEAQDETARPAVVQADRGAAEAEAAPLRILLADDHETNRRVVGLILESAGVELTGVENGAEAVDAFKANRFDVVLMDVQMPVMDGLTAIRAIRAIERRAGGAATPILVLSAHAMAEHVEASKAAGADAHLAKPVTATALIAAVNEVLMPKADAARAQAAG
jgi:signal transduction histidine kinase/CheY-like chemotaxis protein